MSDGQRVPGPLGLLHPLRAGDELMPGVVVQRAWAWHDRFIFVLSNTRIVVESPRPDSQYVVHTARYGIYVDGPVVPRTERIATRLAELIGANEDDHDPIAARTIGEQSRPHEVPAVFLVPGHLGEPLDLTLRALHTLASAGLILVEPGKEGSARALLARHGIGAAPILGLDERADERVRACIAAGQDVAIFGANEGIPGFCDPGKETLIATDAPIHTLGGASVLGMALMRAPVALDRFAFLGTVHDEGGADEAIDRWATGDLPVVLFSWGRSVPHLIEGLAARPRTPPRAHLLIALTQNDERVVSGSLNALRDVALADREPVVVVIERARSLEPETCLLYTSPSPRD